MILVLVMAFLSAAAAAWLTSKAPTWHPLCIMTDKR